MSETLENLVAKFTWRKWKVGLLISLVFGLLGACSGLTGSMDWRAFVAVLAVSTSTHLGAYLTNHPIEKIEE